MNMKDYCAWGIRCQCAALNNAVLLDKGASSAFAVRVIADKLAGLVKSYLEAAEEEEGGAE